MKQKISLLQQTIGLMFTMWYLQVIPPGMDFSNVVVQEDTIEADGELAAIIGDGSSPRAVPTIWSEVSILFPQPKELLRNYMGQGNINFHVSWVCM